MSRKQSSDLSIKDILFCLILLFCLVAITAGLIWEAKHHFDEFCLPYRDSMSNLTDHPAVDDNQEGILPNQQDHTFQYPSVPMICPTNGVQQSIPVHPVTNENCYESTFVDEAERNPVEIAVLENDPSDIHLLEKRDQDNTVYVTFDAHMWFCLFVQRRVH